MLQHSDEPRLHIFPFAECMGFLPEDSGAAPFLESPRMRKYIGPQHTEEKAMVPDATVSRQCHSVVAFNG